MTDSEGRYKGVIDQVGHIATSYFTELSEKAIDVSHTIEHELLVVCRAWYSSYT